MFWKWQTNNVFILLKHRFLFFTKNTNSKYTNLLSKAITHTIVDPRSVQTKNVCNFMRDPCPKTFFEKNHEKSWNFNIFRVFFKKIRILTFFWIISFYNITKNKLIFCNFVKIQKQRPRHHLSRALCLTRWEFSTGILADCYPSPFRNANPCSFRLYFDVASRTIHPRAFGYGYPSSYPSPLCYCRFPYRAGGAVALSLRCKLEFT